MVTLMESTTDTEKLARCTLGAAELDTFLHLYHHIVNCPSQVLYGSMAILESCQVAIQPRSDMIDTRVEQIIQARRKFCDKFRVGHELPWRARDPGLQQGDELHLNLCWWNWLSIRSSENGHSVITLHDEASVKILGTWSETEVHTLISYGTFKGSSSRSISENPVASAICRRAESDLARCSAMVSVERINSREGKKDHVTNEKVLASHWPASRRR